MAKPPYVIGGFLILCGYFFTMWRGLPRPIPVELTRFRQREQKDRLKRLFFRRAAKS